MAVNSVDQVFISYSRKDETVMRRVVGYLNREGIHAWLDNEKLVPGTPIWEEEIEKAIKSAAALIVIMSPDSKNSEWVRREISLADDHHKRIFPLLVRGDEDTSITLRLITRQFIDMRANEEVGLKSLSIALSRYLEGLNVHDQIPVTQAVTEAGGESISSKLVPPASISTKSLRQFAAGKTESTIRSNAVFWITLGWIVGGAVGGWLYWTAGDYSEVIGGAVGWAIGGLTIGIILYMEHILANWKSVLWMVLAWAIGGAIGWTVSEARTEASGAALGGAIAAAIGSMSTLRLEHLSVNWKRVLWMVLAWAIGWAIGWLISRYFQTQLGEGPIGWTIGWAVGSAIGGLVTGWQMMKSAK